MQRLARAALQAPLEQACREAPGVGHVDVRVGPVGDQCIGRRQHLLRDVGMQVEAGNDRDPRPGQRANPRQQLALGVVEMVGDRGAVQVEVDRVEGAAFERALHVADDHAGEALERVLGDLRRRRRPGPARRHEAPAALARRFDEAADRDVVADHRLDHRVAFDEGREGLAAVERGPVGARRREGVGLVQEAADQHALHRISIGAHAIAASVSAPAAWPNLKPRPGAAASNARV